MKGQRHTLKAFNNRLAYFILFLQECPIINLMG